MKKVILFVKVKWDWKASRLRPNISETDSENFFGTKFVSRLAPISSKNENVLEAGRPRSRTSRSVKFLAVQNSSIGDLVTDSLTVLLLLTY